MRHKDAVMHCPWTRYPWKHSYWDQSPGFRDPLIAGTNQSLAQLTQLRPLQTLPNPSQHYVSPLIGRDISIRDSSSKGTKNTWDRKSRTHCLRTHWLGTHCHVTVKTHLAICWEMTARCTFPLYHFWMTRILTPITSNWPRIDLGFTGSARRRSFWSEEARPDSPAATTSGSSLRASSETQRSDFWRGNRIIILVLRPHSHSLNWLFT
jgi:hypothetical protein